MLSSNTSAVSGDANYIEDVFSTYLYTGTGATNSINNAIDLSTKGGLTWIKSRDSTPSHNLFDTVRGATKLLVTNSTAAQTTDATTLTSFNSNGFTLGADTTNNAVNRAGGYTYASWTFRKQPKFFDVVTYTGNDTTQNISHSLGSTPGCVIVKCTNAAAGWYVWHRGQTAGYYSILNTTAAQTNGSSVNTFGNNTTYVDPTSTQFTVGSNGNINQTGNTYVAYIFAHNAGGFGLTGTDNVISCGSVTDDGSGNGVFANLGWEPQWVLVKRSNGVENWAIADSMRGMAAVSVADNSNGLIPNTSGAEALTAITGRISATGWTSPTGRSAGQTFIYIAIRRGPMKVPTDGTKVFSSITRSGNNTATNISTVGFTPDLLLSMVRTTAGANHGLFDRLRGSSNFVRSNSTGVEVSDATGVENFSMDGFRIGTDTTGYSVTNVSGYTYVYQNFRRAPSFFDEVCFTGAASGNQTLNHNLTVIPELFITKSRGSATNWRVYSATTGVDKYLQLNLTSAAATSSGFWPSTPTSTTFSVTPANIGVSTWPAVAYLFATCAGVSKVGSYTGTGTTKQIDCGFAAGARFVLIKRTDSTGDWYVWDSARGIVSGNDSYLLLNSTAAEVTSTDYIDTYSAGFEISSSAPAAINASGGTFIFLAIA